ncbi:hypothetical protein SUGI_0408880 [Cryptomeria japonica]|nr:hypothetical protein SUGI_0408880 [Cryptomeria japonica]
MPEVAWIIVDEVFGSFEVAPSKSSTVKSVYDKANSLDENLFSAFGTPEASKPPLDYELLTVEDKEYKGYPIPKGWKAIPLFRIIHHRPEFFPDPLRFEASKMVSSLLSTSTDNGAYRLKPVARRVAHNTMTGKAGNFVEEEVVLAEKRRISTSTRPLTPRGPELEPQGAARKTKVNLLEARHEAIDFFVPWREKSASESKLMDWDDNLQSKVKADVYYAYKVLRLDSVLCRDIETTIGSMEWEIVKTFCLDLMKTTKCGKDDKLWFSLTDAMIFCGLPDECDRLVDALFRVAEEGSIGADDHIIRE